MIKKLIISSSMIVSSFVILEKPVDAAISNKPGDIIITNSTSGSGIVGHSGIYIDATHILHASGWKSEPYPKVITEKSWHARYKQSKVVRSTSSTIGKKAADKAKYYFQNKKIPYKVSRNPTNITNTYCSELIWYSYYKAGKTIKTRNSSGFFQPKEYVKPYDFINYSIMDYNNLKYVDNKW